MERKSATPKQELSPSALAYAAPSWYPMWASWCCGVPNPAAMWASQFQAAFQQGLEQGRREAAAHYAAAIREPGKN